MKGWDPSLLESGLWLGNGFRGLGVVVFQRKGRVKEM